jgi:hypothetical protein
MQLLPHEFISFFPSALQNGLKKVMVKFFNRISDRPKQRIYIGSMCILRCIQKFPDRVDKEIHAYNNKHSLTGKTKCYGGKIHYTDIAIQLHLVAESCTICSSRSRRPVRKLLDTPSYITHKCYVLI